MEMNDGMGEQELRLWDRIAVLQSSLAEKDREILKWRRIRTPTHGTCCTCQGCGLDHDSCRCDLDEVCDDLDQLKKAYQQLMAQAVRFASTVDDVSWVQNTDEWAAREFLKSPAVQAFLEKVEVKP